MQFTLRPVNRVNRSEMRACTIRRVWWMLSPATIIVNGRAKTKRGLTKGRRQL